MKTLLLIFLTSLSAHCLASTFDQSSIEKAAQLKARAIVAKAEKRCLATKRVYTACLKNLQLQAIEKKISVLEKTYGLVHKKAQKGKARDEMLRRLQKQIAYETQFVDFYHDRAFDGTAALELDLRHLLVKQARLEYLKSKGSRSI